MNDLISLKSVCKNYSLARETKGLMAWSKQLIKPKYDLFQALDSIELAIKNGAAVGFIGPNGAGKSSLIKILCGIQKPSSGQVRVLGCDPSLREKKFLKQIGVVFGHKTSLWWDLPVKTSFDTYKEIYGIPDNNYLRRLSELSDALNLVKVLHKPVRNLSLGERVKCELTLNLLHSPKLIFLDEPTVGLDVTSKYEIRRYLNHERKTNNLSVFLTSHDLGDIEACCDDAIIIDKGRIRFDGSMRELSRTFRTNVKLTVSTQDITNSEKGLLAFKKAIESFPEFSILNDGSNQTSYIVPRSSISAIFSLFREGIYDLEVSSLDFENSVVNLFKTWSDE
ncbi:ABC-2 type transport system ATP-binding protein [Pseudomonas sp. NFACC23-1]|uniref:ABC transporter ATP-binding protein n=1 Tax=unclassified Pseudomonas TaxID=196821 RepID=UPI000887D62A|nr:MULTISPECIES: ATP-binding cassette domain-containing protein [unclassified Pseudomonas]SDB37418.1 ABC-2 type transport system ATP-binding protein [Pseudomonas sp. NFACC17-2]SEJ54551.1 ABC-2 type transport system ATP-binding protein [Pseudomonas sp. NFACC23-1]SFW71922.1 ABC-2 type transport system ATP-binding protein [Pseudomonas sp. NFACC16-2]